MDRQNLRDYEAQLCSEEKTAATQEKYLRDVRAFLSFLGTETPTKELTLSYKRRISESYAVRSVNSMLSAVNHYLRSIGRSDCCVKLVRLQRSFFSSGERELGLGEYKRLVRAAGEGRLSYILQTLCMTGIRISELRYITVEAVQRGRVAVYCKSKSRIVFLPKPISRILKRYIKSTGIKSGAVFVTKSGKPIDRANIWREMKSLCARARVRPEKVFPHNLRHLFARIFYTQERDVLRLSELLGHSSVESTRIYTQESGEKHIESLSRVQKLLTT